LIFVDSNVPMYLVRAAHANKTEARRLLEGCFHREERLVTDAEIFQEILHRYAAIQRRDAIQPAFEAVLGVIDEVFPVELEDIERAKTVLLRNEWLSARAWHERHAAPQLVGTSRLSSSEKPCTRIV
jgi:hypothetical protein